MGGTTYDTLRERYAAHYGVAAGYLPSNLDGVTEWLLDLAAALDDDGKCPPTEHPTVAALRQLIASDRQVRGLVDGMIQESHGLHAHGHRPIKDSDMLL